MKYLMVFLLLGLITSCQSDTKVKIGVLGPLTGPAAELGQHVLQGVELANAQLGSKYELIVEDTKCDAAVTLNAVQNFIRENIHYVIGPLCAPEYQATAGLLNRNKIVFMHTSGITQPFIDAAGEYGIAGLTTTLAEEDAFLAQFMRLHENLTRIGLLIWDEEWAVAHEKGLEESVTRLGGTIVFREHFTLNDNDFRTVLFKLKESGAEGIFLVGLNFQTAEIVKQMKETNSAIPIFTQFEVEDPAFIVAAGDAANNVMYVYPKIEQSKEVTQFKSDFERSQGSIPNYYSYIGYDALLLYDNALKNCADATCVSNALKSTTNFEGVGGKLSLKGNMLIRDFEIRMIQNSTPLIVYPT